jgi:hypothetical protein
MADTNDGALIVYLVTGEYCFSENGEVAWTEGAYRTVASAESAAQEAADDHSGRRCLVDGKPYGPNWDCECEGPKHVEHCTANRGEWDVSFEVQPIEVLD